MTETSERIQIVMTASDVITPVLKAVSSNINSFGAKAQKTFSTLQKNWAATATSLYSLKKAFDFADEAATFKQMEQGFANLAASYGADANKIIADLKRVSAGTVSTAQIMQQAGTAMALSIPADKLNKMMEVSRAASRIMGKSTTEMFEKLTIGLARQSKLRLDDLSIIVDAEKANKRYAETMGIVGRKLTDAERKQAFFNDALRSGEDLIRRVNVQGLSAAEGMAVFKAGVSDLKVMLGEGLVAISSFITAGLLGLSAAFATTVGAVDRAISWMIELGSRLPWVGDKFKAASAAVKVWGDFQFSAADEAKYLAKQAFNVGTSMFAETKAIEGVTTAIKTQIEAKKELSAEDEKELARLERKFAALQKRQRLENEHLGEHEVVVQRRLELMGIEISNEKYFDEITTRTAQSRSAVVGQAYESMQDQMLNLIETGRFSVAAFADVIAQQVKIELTGLAARAAVWAIFETAMGFATMFTNPPASAAHFTSAGEFAAVSAATLAAAATAQGLFGGTAEKPAPGAIGGEPLITTETASTIAPQQNNAPTQTVTVNVYNSSITGDIPPDTIDAIIDGIAGAGKRNVTIDVRNIN